MIKLLLFKIQKLEFCLVTDAFLSKNVSWTSIKWILGKIALGPTHLNQKTELSPKYAVKLSRC